MPHDTKSHFNQVFYLNVELAVYIPLLLSPPPTMNQFSPTVTPACPARGVGISPCCEGLDHSIYTVEIYEKYIIVSVDNEMDTSTGWSSYSLQIKDMQIIETSCM